MGQTFTQDGVVYEDMGNGQVRIVGYADAPMPPARVGTPDPTRGLDVTLKQQQIDENARKVEAEGLRTKLSELDAQIKQQQIASAGTEPSAQQAKQRRAALASLEQQINRVTELYQSLSQDPARLSVSLGLPAFPTSENRQFEAAAAGLAEQGLSAFRVPGVGSQSDAELRQFVQANRPTASNFNSEIEEKLRQLRGRVDATRAELGLPAAQWSAALPAGSDGGPQASGFPNPPSSGGGPGPLGETRRAAPDEQIVFNDETPPPRGSRYTAEQEEQIRQAIRNQDRGQAIALSERFSGGKHTPQTIQRIDDLLAYIRRNPNGPINFDYSAGDRAAEDAYEKERYGDYLDPAIKGREGAAVGSGGRGALSGLTFGVAPYIGAAANSLATGQPFSDRLQYARALDEADRRVNPWVRAGGEVVGSAASVGGLQAGLGSTVGRLPGMFGAAGRAPLTADVLYGAGVGTASGGDPVTGALAGAGGGLVGRAVVRGTGNVVGGVRDASVRYLADRGIPLTPGQVLSQSGVLGRAVKGFEDAIDSVPVIGSAIRSRRGDSFEAFNREAFRQQSAPIGVPTPTDIAEQGVEQAFDNSGLGFRNALGGQSVPIDATAQSQIVAAARRAAATPTYGDDFRTIIADEIDPILSGPQMTGEQFQALNRTIGGYGRQYDKIASGTASVPPAPMARRVAEGFQGIDDALSGTVERNAPGVLPAYRDAQSSYRMARVLQDAVNRARSGTRTGEVGQFSPSQLADAAASNSAKFGGGQGTTRQPFFELTRAGQQVLPSSIPNSGTADRALASLAVPSLFGGSALVGQQTGLLDPGSAAALAGIGLLYTRPGQRAAQYTLTARPRQARQFGDAIRDRQRLGGMFGAPLAIPLFAGPPAP